LIKDTLDTHVPYHYASRKEQRSFNKPWLTKGILTSIAKKNTLYRKQLTTNNPNIIRKCKTYRNRLTHLKEISKQNYYKQAFQKCHHDIKKTWKLVNEIITIKNKSQQNNRLFKDSECQKQSEDLNNFYSEVGKSLSTKIKPSPTTYRHFITHVNSKNSLFLAPTDAYEIQLLSKNLKVKSNTSPNGIPPKFLKTASCIVTEWLSKFLNKCMITGEFPDSWKIATITPIPKVRSQSSLSEYRPISVLPVLSKLFEKVLYHRVYSYLTEHNLIDERQYGFRENHSTELAIASIYDELLRNFDNKLITCSLSLDLPKAFDCCDHKILLDKLYHYGIRGVYLKLFSNFLHNRMQCTKIWEFKSSYKRISCGVPQGSVISPLLFLIYS